MTAIQRARTSAQTTAGAHLHSRRGDFWALGGASLVVVPIALLLPASSTEAAVAKIVTLVAIAINYPHFAASYTIFYSRFGKKSAPGYGDDPTLYLRYRFAGVVVPLALTSWFLVTVLGEHTTALGYSYNVMLFFVGWHYVKQGYGMAMVDAALKRRFFSAGDKRSLRLNAYAAWATAWIAANRYTVKDDFFEVPFETFDIPAGLHAAAAGVLVVTTVDVSVRLWQRHLSGTPTAWTGVSAYAFSLYPWMVFIYYDAILLLVIPALHSFQYLWVISRYQTNKAAAEADAPSWRRLYGTAVVLGVAMFWVVPLLFDSMGLYGDGVGQFAFLFAFWIGINVHHYFLDNVMWRRGNPDVNRHLFSHAAH